MMMMMERMYLDNCTATQTSLMMAQNITTANNITTHDN